MAKNTLQARYDTLAPDRTNYLDRARDSAEVTLPYIMPEKGSNSATDFENPYQSVGATGVQSLASKLVTTLFPTNTSFFDIKLPPEVLRQHEQQQGTTQGKTEKALNDITRKVNNHIDTSNYRSVLTTSFLHLLITGNILLWVKDGKIIQYPLDAFVVQRDKSGTILQIVCVENVSPLALAPEIVQACKLDIDKKDYQLYSAVILKDGKYEFSQEINEITIPNSETTYNKDSLPMLALQYTNTGSDQHYGRSLVDSIISDLNSLDSLTKSILEGSALSSTSIMGVNPDMEGDVDLQKLATAKSGSFVFVRPEDVQPIQFNKNNDLKVAEATSDKIEQRLNKIFLQPSAAYTGKQLTATEVRWIAGQLETALGGVYSTLQNSLQIPLLHIIIKELTKSGAIPDIPQKNGYINIKIVAGVGGLGRNRDLENISTLMQVMASLGQDNISKFVNMPELITRVSNSLNIDTQDLIKTSDQIAQEEQAQRQALERQALLEQMQKSAGSIVEHDAKNNAKNNVDNPQPN